MQYVLYVFLEGSVSIVDIVTEGSSGKSFLINVM